MLTPTSPTYIYTEIRQWQDPEAGAERSSQGREEHQSHGEGEIVNEDIGTGIILVCTLMTPKTRIYSIHTVQWREMLQSLPGEDRRIGHCCLSHLVM